MISSQNLILFFSIIFIVITSCNTSISNEDNGGKSKNDLTQVVVEIDLAEIVSRDTLKAITIFGPTSYFLYRGQAMGFEYEILEDLAEKLDLHLELVVSRNIDELFEILNKGDGDLIAYGLAITAARKKIIDFTIPYTSYHQVLVQRKPDNWRKLSYKEKQKALISDVTELGGKTIAVRESSSYYERLMNLSEEIGDSIKIQIVPGEFSTYEIIQKVSEGEYQYTIADNSIAQLNNSYYSNIDISIPVSFSQKIAWSVRKSSPQLRNSLDSLFELYIGSARFNVIYNKYFQNNKSFKKHVSSNYYTITTGKISPYDDLIKKNSENLEWDWLLVSSIVYQESRFNPKSDSWAGAGGLMQIMPNTAKSLGVNDVNDPEQSIRGGTKYLKILYDRWTSIPDSIQRIKFTMASYNCGYGHVQDAQRLAISEGKNELIWDDGVDECILKLSKPKYYNRPEIAYGYVRGSEPYNYVKDIFARYEEYKEMTSK